MKLLALAIAASATTAVAEPAKLAAIASDPSNVSLAILVGPGGQVYGPVPPRVTDRSGAAASATPDPGGWTRASAGGIAAGATVAARAGDDIFAANASAPPYRWHDGGWSAVPLPAKGALVLGAGPAVSAAVGTAVFVRSGNAWTRAATAPSAPTALWAASPTQIWILADGAAWHLRGKAFERGPAAIALAQSARPVALAPSKDQAIDLATSRAVAAKAPIVAASTAAADTWLLLATGAVEHHHGKATDTLTPPAHAWAWIWTDSHGRAAVAAPTGEVAIFDGHAWRDAPVDTTPPAAHAGPGPATSR